LSKLVELNAKLPQKIDAKSEAREAEIIAKKIANGEYSGTFIDGKKIYSPEIYGNKISVVTTTGEDNGFHIYGEYGGKVYDMFRIAYYGENFPDIFISSPEGNRIYLGTPKKTISFNGTVDFAGAEVMELKLNSTFG